MNRYVNICAALTAFLVGSTSALAQGGYQISGTVTDAVGPVVGATVVELGTSNGTSTGPDGGYSLTVSSPDSPVEFSCMGYATQTYDASMVPSTVTLKEDSQYLDEVVVIGYGTVKKDDLTGSISAIKASTYRLPLPLCIRLMEKSSSMVMTSMSIISRVCFSPI